MPRFRRGRTTHHKLRAMVLRRLSGIGQTQLGHCAALSCLRRPAIPRARRLSFAGGGDLAHNMLLLSRIGSRALAQPASPPMIPEGAIGGTTIMPVDLTGSWTDADIAALIGSVNDDRDWRLEVSAVGVADLSDKTANPTDALYDETLHCFLETWMEGTDFVGASAAGDRGLVGKISKALRDNYPTLKGNRFVYVSL